jgi:transposase
MKQYDEEFKKKIIRLHLEEGRSLKGLADEYGVSKAAISKWTKLYRKECQITASTQSEYDYMQENLKLRKQLEEMEKENRFLKKAAAFFAKEIE